MFSIIFLVIAPSYRNFLRYNDFTSIKDLIDRVDVTIDFSGRIFGMRKLMADILWIKMLQYYSGHDFNVTDETSYPELINYFKRIILLSPDWSRSAEWGAGVIAFNHRRYSQAMELLKLARNFRPNYTRFNMYIAAIGYIDKNMEEEAIRELEEIASTTDSLTVLNMLANIYKKRGDYRNAIKTYIKIIEVGETLGAYYSGYVENAKKNLEMLKYIK